MVEYNTLANRHEIAGLVAEYLAPDEMLEMVIQTLVEQMESDQALFEYYVESIPGQIECWEDEEINHEHHL